jgi:hypothetical protein
MKINDYITEAAGIFSGPFRDFTVDELEAASAWLLHGDIGHKSFHLARQKLINYFSDQDIPKNPRKWIYDRLSDEDRYHLDMNDMVDTPFEEKDPNAGDDQLELDLEPEPGSDEDLFPGRGKGKTVRDMKPDWPFKPEEFNK